MLDNLQLWVFGAAALVDTVLLFALLERHNWRAVTIWMLLLALGVWSWHVGYFVLVLITDSAGSLAGPMHWASMLAMAFGLMLMPSAAVHGTGRLLQHGHLRTGSHPDLRFILCYLPMVLLVPMGRALATDSGKSFVDLLVDFRIPYAVWLGLVSGFASYGLRRTGKVAPDITSRRFYHLLAVSMLVIAGTASLYIFSLNRFPALAAYLKVVVILLPVIPAILFAYFVMRFQLLPVVLERTLVYGAVLVGAMLFHQIVFVRMMSSIGDQYQLDWGLVEGSLAFLVILLYQPLRVRVAEAMQSLLDSSRSRRSERQRLAVQLATRAADPPPDLLDWFISAIQRSFETNPGAAWLSDRDGRVFEKAGMTTVLGDDDVRPIHSAMARSGSPFVTRFTAVDPLVTEFLDRVRAGALLRFEHAEVSGLFLIGCRRWGQPPSDEDLHVLALLVEQFGITLHNSRLIAIQVATEHRFLQQEKMSTLGLIASSLAHEIRNPLSSIKTIIRVLAEDLGPDSRYAEDLQMIDGEIERLSASTSELLSAARPPGANLPPAPLADILSPTLRLLQFLARQREIFLDVTFPAEPLILTLDQVGVREIVFNLITNAVDACGPGGRVQFVCRSESGAAVIEIHDSGSGISPEQRDLIFEPFFTTKSTGTGLGLYIVARRVRDMGGQIDCQSVPGQGTIFLVKLPQESNK